MTRNAYRQGKKQVNVVMSDVLHRQLVTSAASRGLTVQAVVVEAVREWIMAQTPSAATSLMDVFAAEEPVVITSPTSDDLRKFTPKGYFSPLDGDFHPFPFEETP